MKLYRQLIGVAGKVSEAQIFVNPYRKRSSASIFPCSFPVESPWVRACSVHACSVHYNTYIPIYIPVTNFTRPSIWAAEPQRGGGARERERERERDKEGEREGGRERKGK